MLVPCLRLLANRVNQSVFAHSVEFSIHYDVVDEQKKNPVKYTVNKSFILMPCRIIGSSLTTNGSDGAVTCPQLSSSHVNA